MRSELLRLWGVVGLDLGEVELLYPLGDGRWVQSKAGGHQRCSEDGPGLLDRMLSATGKGWSRTSKTLALGTRREA